MSRTARTAIVLSSLFFLTGLGICGMSLAQPCQSLEADLDGDQIPNEWEAMGVDVNRDGKIDFDLKARGADPLHKDIFLEIDYMEFHQPFLEVIPHVVDAFSKAPLCNPDGVKGIKLHVELDEEITPHNDSIIIIENISGKEERTWKGFFEIKDKYFGTAIERLDTNPNLLRAKIGIYHYVVFAHTWNNRSNSGTSPITGMDFVVSLGKFSVKDPATGHNTGSVSHQEGTLMHEFGHNLGLRHGGGDGSNCKPNYLSVMSYTRQFATPISNRQLDYSHKVLEPLDERKLNETAGIGDNDPPGAPTAYGPGPTRLGITDVPIDWNADLDFKDTILSEDINYVINPITGNEICSQSPNQLLMGHDDWSNLTYRAGMTNFSTQLSPSDLDPNAATSLHHNITEVETEYEEELSPEDVTAFNIDLISSINKALNNLPEQSFKTGINDSKSGSHDALTEVLEYVKTENLDQAIEGLNDLLPKMDSSFGGMQSDDTIVDPEAQRKIATLVRNAIESFKSQGCTANECIVAEKRPNSTLVYG